MATMEVMRKILLVVAILAGCSGGSGLAAADLPDAGERPHDSAAETAVPDASDPEDDAGEPEDTGHLCDDVAYLPCDCGDGAQGRMPCTEDPSQWTHCVCEPDASEPDTSTTDSGMDAADSALDAPQDSTAHDIGAAQDSAIDTGSDCAINRVLNRQKLPEAGVVELTTNCKVSSGMQWNGTLLDDNDHKPICRKFCNSEYACAQWFWPIYSMSDAVCKFAYNEGPYVSLEYYCLICK